MAGGIEWFRWHHGSVTDPKFQLVARMAGASLPDVLAVWAYLLETASSEAARGRFTAVDCEAWDCLFAFQDGRTASILEAMTKRGLIEDGAVINWEKRQPKRERDNDKSTERVRAFRAMKRHETPCNATDDQETPREEKRREEREEEICNLTVATALRAEDRPSLAMVKAKKPPDCPHLEVLALWAEVLPHAAQHLPSQWRGTRATHLRARWRETASEKGWTDVQQGLAYLRKLFGYVAQSPFLMGRAPPRNGGRPFEIELAWLVNPTNWAKVLEGKFHATEAA